MNKNSGLDLHVVQTIRYWPLCCVSAGIRQRCYQGRSGGGAHIRSLLTDYGYLCVVVFLNILNEKENQRENW